MADNVVLNPGTGGQTMATDDVGGIQFQYVKLAYGADGVATPVTATNPLPIRGNQGALTTAVWNSATAVNTVLNIDVTNQNTVTLIVAASTTITAGIVTFEVAPDNATWFPINGARIDAFEANGTYTILANINRAWAVSVEAYTNIRIRLSTVITGTGSVTVGLAAQTFAIEPMVTVGNIIPHQLLATHPEMRAATNVITATAAVNTAVTATLPAVAGMFHYITAIQITKLYAVAGVANAAGVIITTTNLNSLAFTTEQIASTIGTAPRVVDLNPSTPIRSAVLNTATTIVCPAQTQTIWRVSVFYFLSA